MLETEHAIEENKRKLAELMRLAEISTGLPKQSHLPPTDHSAGSVQSTKQALPEQARASSASERAISREVAKRKEHDGSGAPQQDDELFTRSKHQSENVGDSSAATGTRDRNQDQAFKERAQKVGKFEQDYSGGAPRAASGVERLGGQISVHAHRKNQARDISEKNVKRSQQIVSQKQ